MNKIVYLALLISMLACGASAELPQPEVFTQTAIPTEAAQSVNMAQIVGSWNIRETPGGEVMTTLTNAEVQVIFCKPATGGWWCEVEYQGIRGWVNKRGLK